MALYLTHLTFNSFICHLPTVFLNFLKRVKRWLWFYPEMRFRFIHALINFIIFVTSSSDYSDSSVQLSTSWSSQQLWATQISVLFVVKISSILRSPLTNLSSKTFNHRRFGGEYIRRWGPFQLIVRSNSNGRSVSLGDSTLLQGL